MNHWIFIWLYLKALGTLDQNILTQRLYYYIKGTALDLFKGYLTKHKYFVEFGEAKSDMLKMTTLGVPQG